MHIEVDLEGALRLAIIARVHSNPEVRSRAEALLKSLLSELPRDLAAGARLIGGDHLAAVPLALADKCLSDFVQSNGEDGRLGATIVAIAYGLSEALLHLKRHLTPLTFAAILRGGGHVCARALAFAVNEGRIPPDDEVVRECLAQVVSPLDLLKHLSPRAAAQVGVAHLESVVGALKRVSIAEGNAALVHVLPPARGILKAHWALTQKPGAIPFAPDDFDFSPGTSSLAIARLLDALNAMMSPRRSQECRAVLEALRANGLSVVFEEAIGEQFAREIAIAPAEHQPAPTDAPQSAARDDPTTNALREAESALRRGHLPMNASASPMLIQTPKPSYPVQA